MSFCKSQRGVTLIELMVTVAVFAIGATLAYPSFTSVIRSNRVATSTNNFIGAFNLARSEAIRSNRGGAVCPSADGQACFGTDWSVGLLVFTDSDGSGTWSAGDVVVRHFEVDAALDVDGNNLSEIAFDNRGRLPSQLQITIVPDDCPAGQELLRTVDVGRSGQTRVNKGACA